MPAAKRTTAAKTVAKQEVYLDFELATKNGILRYKEPKGENGKRPILGTVYVHPDVAEKLGLEDELLVTLSKPSA